MLMEKMGKFSQKTKKVQKRRKEAKNGGKEAKKSGIHHTEYIVNSLFTTCGLRFFCFFRVISGQFLIFLKFSLDFRGGI
jgi:hypothetical protein